MPPHSKRTSRRNGRVGPRSVQELSQSETLDRQLAKRSDKISLKDKTLVGIISGTTVLTNTSFNLNPAVSTSFGSRVSAISSYFTRYRILKLLVRYTPVVGTATSGRVALGFLDDATNDEGSLPTTVGQVAALRCARVDSPYRDIELEWKPIDPMKWYYTVGTVTGTDQRFTTPAALIISTDSFATSVTAGSFSFYYTIEFEGAITASN